MLNMKVVGLFLSFPTYVHSSHLDQRSPSYDRFGKTDLQARPSELVASAGCVPLLLPALTGSELALGYILIQNIETPRAAVTWGVFINLMRVPHAFSYV
ncbi:hypothetical protein P8452_22024 [Trifolium repens]|nr:hypothetical protein P8452_22024 [Trifolium repens]